MNAHAKRLRGIVDALEVQDLLPLSRKHIRSAANEIERLQAQVDGLRRALSTASCALCCVCPNEQMHKTSPCAACIVNKTLEQTK